VNSILTVEEFIENITSKPRSVFGIKTTYIAEGEMADISLFNPEQTYTFTKEHILSISKNSPFINTQLNGKVYGIFSNNQLILNS
jgi:dihydroorotase